MVFYPQENSSFLVHAGRALGERRKSSSYHSLVLSVPYVGRRGIGAALLLSWGRGLRPFHCPVFSFLAIF